MPMPAPGLERVSEAENIKEKFWLSIYTTLERRINVRRRWNMPEAKQIARPTPYASKADFGQIFHEDMNELYLLSFLLTGDREKAEQCFVFGLEDAVEGSPVFKEWARSWARRAIIQNAVRLVNPRPDEGIGHSRSPSLNSASINGNSKTASSE